MALIFSPTPIKKILFFCIILFGGGGLIAHNVMIKDCPACKGAKFITAHCPECGNDGKPRVTCRTCNGTGMTCTGIGLSKCIFCRGIGKQLVVPPKCPDCKGTKKGKLGGKCNKCNGAGFYPICGKCKYGQLRDTCTTCKGTGRQK